jgi:hypothetical protein
VTTDKGKTKITVTWDDADKATDIANFTVGFAPKDGSQPAPPASANTADGTTKTLDFTPADGSSPSANDLKSNYFATVTANPSNAKAFSPSATGVQAGLLPYWDFNVSLFIKLGDKPITLTKPPSSSGTTGGVYRLPASTDKPITITADDINSLVGTTVVPSTLFGKPAPSLSISELAVDTDNKLFAMDVSVDLGITLFKGLTIDSLKFDVERTDGVHKLDNPPAAS